MWVLDALNIESLILQFANSVNIGTVNRYVTVLWNIINCNAQVVYLVITQ